MKERKPKYTAKEIVMIIFLWLFALSFVYMVYLKFKILKQ